MQDKFVKIEEIDSRIIYLKPEDVVALEWDECNETTAIYLHRGTDLDIVETRLTPGFIFDRCNKVLEKINPCAKRW